MDKIPEFNLSFIRHGESETNSQPDKMGQDAEDPLTQLGKDQAQKLHGFYQKKNHIWDMIYSSHYRRALNTATIVTGVHEDHLVLSGSLREYDAGKWVGVSRSQTITPDVKYKMSVLNHNFLPPHGESLSQVERRAGKWLEDYILYNEDFYKEYLSANRPLEIAVFSHGLTIKCFLHYIMGFDKSFIYKMVIDNTSVSKVSFGAEGWKVNFINNCSHLENI